MVLSLAARSSRRRESLAVSLLMTWRRMALPSPRVIVLMTMGNSGRTNGMALAAGVGVGVVSSSVIVVSSPANSTCWVSIVDAGLREGLCRDILL